MFGPRCAMALKFKTKGSKMTASHKNAKDVFWPEHEHAANERILEEEHTAREN